MELSVIFLYYLTLKSDISIKQVMHQTVDNTFTYM